MRTKKNKDINFALPKGTNIKEAFKKCLEIDAKNKKKLDADGVFKLAMFEIISENAQLNLL